MLMLDARRARKARADMRETLLRASERHAAVLCAA